MIVADFSMKNGRENRTNGNQEKGKEEKEALTSQYEVEQKGTRKASPKFLRGSSAAPFVSPSASLRPSQDWVKDSESVFHAPGRDRETRRSCSRNQVWA